MDLSSFFGRFHLVLVHLPIGFLLLAAAMQVFSKTNGLKKLDDAIVFSLLLGAICAILSAGGGWLLAAGGDYVETTLFLHRWMGIGLAGLAAFCWLVKTGRIKTPKNVYPVSLTILALMVIYTGHLGGTLTHGEGYLLKFAPSFLKSFFGSKTSTRAATVQFSNPDSTFFFNDILLPLLKEKCGDCHNEKNKKGGLDLTTKEGFLRGGEHDEIFIAGVAAQSEIFVRVTLPGNDEKFMPPKGEALSYDQIKLLEWWINEGASFEKPISQYDLPKDMEMLFSRNYGLETKPVSFVETLHVTAVTDSVYQNLEAHNFKVSQLATNNNLLEISLQPGVKSITSNQLETLLEAKEQITWLSLGNTDISNDALSILQQLQNLTRLRLERTKVSDQGIALISKLPHLESLNLYGTSVSDQCIESIVKMRALKNIYLWQTNISPQGIELLKTQRPDLQVITGLTVTQKN